MNYRDNKKEPQMTTIKLDARKRLNLSKYYPHTDEVRVTQQDNHLIVEPIIPLTKAEYKAITDPEIVLETEKILAADYKPVGKTRAEILADLRSSKAAEM